MNNRGDFLIHQEWHKEKDRILMKKDTELRDYGPGEVITYEGAIKHDEGKLDFTYVSYELMEAIAQVRAFGAKKYSRSNWKKGFKITRSLAAALRHIFRFLDGETLDPESGLSHLSHAVCCLEHAIYDMKHRAEANDDRKA